MTRKQLEALLAAERETIHMLMQIRSANEGIIATQERTIAHMELFIIQQTRIMQLHGIETPPIPIHPTVN
jgi:hypothetical protein